MTSLGPPQGLSAFPFWSKLKWLSTVLTSPSLVQSHYSFVGVLAVYEHALMFYGTRMTLVMHNYTGLV